MTTQQTRTFTSELPSRIGAPVRVRGFVETVRDQKRMQFLILRDRSGSAQSVHARIEGEDPIGGCLASLTPGSAVTVTGRVVAAPGVRLGGVEVIIEAIEIESLAESPLPISQDSALEKQIDWRAVSLRRPDQQLVFAVQTTVERAMREFWAAEGFVEIHSPKLMGTFSESGAEAFRVGYFGGEAYLAQSPQFYKQMAIAGGMEKVFEIGPAFRAEPSFTTRHETEFTSVDMEVAWIDLHHDIMALEERWLAHILDRVAESHGGAIQSAFGIAVPQLREPIPRLTMEEAHARLCALGHTPLKPDDMDVESERRIAAHMRAETGCEFLFITDYPASARAFYHRRHDDRPDLTRSFDLFWKGIEITTGAQREHRLDRLMAQAVERGYALEPLKGYFDFFRHGCPPHGGLGLGLARLVMLMLGRPSIREATLLSRTPNRLLP